MKSLLIVYHTQSGTCAQMAHAAASGARREEGLQVSIMRAWDAGVADLAQADGLLLVAAENSATVSGGMKDFLDRVFYPAIDRALVLPCALLLGAGNDGRGAQQQVQRILRGIPFPCALEPTIVRGEFSDAARARCEEYGEAFAAGLHMGIY